MPFIASQLDVVFLHLDRLIQVSFKHVHRSANEDAYALVKQGVRCTTLMFDDSALLPIEFQLASRSSSV